MTDPAFVTGTNPMTLRLQFNPTAAGERVVVTAANGFSLNPPEQVLTVSFRGDCQISGQLAEGASRGHILIRCKMVKTVVPAPAGVTLPAEYTARVVCDGGTDASVTLPGAGGEGSPLLTVAADALCAVGEDIAPLPPGWSLTYSVDGGPPQSTPPVFTVTSSQTVTVTITNDPTAVAVTTVPCCPAPTEPTTVGPTMPDTLPPTGRESTAPAIVGVLLVSFGLLAILAVTRRRGEEPAE